MDNIKYFLLLLLIILTSSTYVKSQDLNVKQYTVTKSTDSIVYYAPSGTDYSYLLLSSDIDSGSYTIDWSAWIVWKGIFSQKEKSGTTLVNSHKGYLNESWIGTQYSTKVVLNVTKNFDKNLNIYIITKAK